MMDDDDVDDDAYYMYILARTNTRGHFKPRRRRNKGL
jgi:hypothetical protein